MAKIRNKSENVAKLILEDNNSYTLNYGDIPKGSNSKVDLQISPEKTFENVRVEASCGCTTPVLKKEGDNYSLVVSYDTNRPGTFSKNVYFRHGEKNNRKVIVINLKGRVI